MVNKRSDFEHLILSPGTKPTDFLSYVEWERSLDRLRAKRCRRLRIRSSSSHASEARTFGIFDRAVNKHPGCVPLWIAYLDFAAQVKASKRWRKIVTRALRLHPTNAQLWTLAGRRAALNGDMERARGHFLRGCRFCTGEATLWIEYARCEMQWLARVEAKKGGKDVRRGVNPAEAIKATEGGEDDGDHIALDDGDSDEDSDNDGELMLPDPDADQGDRKSKPKAMDAEAARKIAESPALNGAIPIAIVEHARLQSFWGPATAEAFFDCFAAFGATVSVHGRVVQHVLTIMEETWPNSPSTCSCQIRHPLVGVDAHSAAFPKALGESLAKLKEAFERTEDKKALALKMIVWADTILAVEGLDEAIRQVLELTKGRLQAVVEAASS